MTSIQPCLRELGVACLKAQGQSRVRYGWDSVRDDLQTTGLGAVSREGGSNGHWRLSHIARVTAVIAQPGSKKGGPRQPAKKQPSYSPETQID